MAAIRGITQMGVGNNAQEDKRYPQITQISMQESV
jgi:hypothetical protein